MCTASLTQFLGKSKKIITLVIFLEGTKSKKRTAHFKNNIFFNGIINICIPPFGKVGKFCGSSISYHSNAAREISLGDLVIPCDSLWAKHYGSFIETYYSTPYLTWWNSTYLLGQSALWTTFGKSKFLWVIPIILNKP